MAAPSSKPASDAPLKYVRSDCARLTTAAVGSAVFFVVAPGVVAGLVPWLISGWDVRLADVAIRCRP